MPMYNHILFHKEQERVIITLNRPDKLNSINSVMRQELLHCFDEMERDDEVKVVIVTGAGKAFCAGADISEFNKPLEAAVNACSVGDTRETGRNGEAVVTTNLVKRVYEFRKPVIGAINGTAAGDGAQLVLAFDLNIASESARFAWPATSLGILCPYGILRLPQEIGRFRSKEVLMTCKYISAQDAFQWGLVNEITPHDKLMDAAKNVADKIAEMPPLSIMAIKEAVNRGMDGYEYAGRIISDLQKTDDFKEGVAAFMEKRKPVFRGR